MRRLALAIIVGMLSFSASGIARLLIAEPCLTFTIAPENDRDCPPTCVTCGCCAQAAEPTANVVAGSPEVPTADFAAVLPPFTEIQPLDILHVPKLRLA